MDKEANMLEELIKVAKKYEYTVTDYMLNNPRIEIGLVRDKEWVQGDLFKNKEV